MPNGSLITALQPVRPGDLIEADFFNKLIAAIQDLDDRLTKLQAECRKSPGAEVRPLVIDTAAVRVGTTLVFTVTGSGLDPADLEERFVIRSRDFEKSFAHQRLKGNDSKIQFAADAEQFAEAGSREAMLRTMGTTGGVETEVTLTISAKRGASDTHALAIEGR